MRMAAFVSAAVAVLLVGLVGGTGRSVTRIQLRANRCWRSRGRWPGGRIRPVWAGQLFDDAGVIGDGQFNTYNGAAGPTANYAVEGQSLPAGPARPGWDGFGLEGNGELFVRHISGVELAGPFIAFARIYHRDGGNMTPNGPQPQETIFGGANTAQNGGWNVYLTSEDTSDGSFQLEARVGSEPLGSSEAMRNGYNGAGPVIPLNAWTDIAVTFVGDSDGDGGNNDEANETLKVYIDGQLDATIVGSAVFLPNVGGVFSSFFGDGYGNSPFNGYYERLMFWDESPQRCRRPGAFGYSRARVRSADVARRPGSLDSRPPQA